MSNIVAACDTCRDIFLNGYTDLIEDDDEHHQCVMNVERELPMQQTSVTGGLVRDAFTKCDVCNIVVDTLHIFKVTAQNGVASNG